MPNLGITYVTALFQGLGWATAAIIYFLITGAIHFPLR